LQRLGKNKPTSKLQTKFSNGNIGQMKVTKTLFSWNLSQEIKTCDPIYFDDNDLHLEDYTITIM
jgi:hypothetical protein